MPKKLYIKCFYLVDLKINRRNGALIFNIGLDSRHEINKNKINELNIKTIRTAVFMNFI
jgi:hypothetical protein